MNLEAVRRLRLDPIRHSYGTRDSILYALGVGYGDRPCDPAQLQFLYEGPGHKAAPSICVVLAHPGFWVGRPELGIDCVRLLHGEQACEVVATMPTRGTVRGEHEIVAVEDKGAEKGAVMHVVKRLFDEDNGRLLALVRSAYVLRGDGGQGGFGDPPPPPEPLPDRSPDIVTDVPTLPQSALVYRLSGDLNPIHADPAAAAAAGFPRPILHGLCTFGAAARGLIEAACGDAPERLRSMSARFSRPVFPGETIRMEIFADGPRLRYRARVAERDVVVLDRGSALLSADADPQPAARTS